MEKRAIRRAGPAPLNAPERFAQTVNLHLTRKPRGGAAKLWRHVLELMARPVGAGDPNRACGLRGARGVERAAFSRDVLDRRDDGDGFGDVHGKTSFVST